MKRIFSLFVFFSALLWAIPAAAQEDIFATPTWRIPGFASDGVIMIDGKSIGTSTIKITKLLPPQVATATPGGAILDSYRIDISIKDQYLRIIEDYQIIHEFKVSTGKYSGSTPKGVMKAYNHALDPISRAYGVHLYRWVAVTANGKIGIHGLHSQGYEKKLGTPASHGCIRLSRPNAEINYDWTVAFLKKNGNYPQVYIY